MRKVVDVPALLDAPVSDTGQSVIESLQELISKLGENIKIRRLVFMNNEGIIGSYCHNGRIGVLVELAKYDAELSKDIAMHIAASKPQVIMPEQLPAALIAKEKEIYLAQFAESGKPAAIIEKMVVGKMQKFINEVSLLKQPYIKDDTITIGDLLTKHNNTVLNFVRFEVGEGIEKETKDFASEVMSQLQQKSK
jgi:elongation factor Ts